MSSNIVNQIAFLRTSREFPEQLHQLTMEVNKSYVDTASAVNSRIIGIFPLNRPAQNGETWFLLGNRRQQGFRQIYTFTSTADIPLGFKISSISQFSRFFGTYKDNISSWYGLNGGTSVPIPGQITFYVVVDGASTTTDTIKFSVGAGAPALTYGTIVLEWLSQP